MARKDWFVQAFRDLCDKGGLLDLQQLCQSESASSTGSAIHDQQGIVNVFKSHPEHFVLANPRDKASCRVFAKTGLRVCPSYSSGKCLDANCPKLHICRFFIAGACKFGDRCKFAHNLDEACTDAKLNSPSYVLERQLSLKGLFSVLLLNDSCLLPEICSHYNTGDGSYGNCIYQSKCTKLHVCRHYILEDCLYHNSCKRSHDFLAPNIKKLLSSKGFGDHIMTDLLGKLRKAAHMQDAMRADAATGATSNDSQMVANMADMSVSNDSENNTDKHEICLYYLRKHCQYKDKCQCMHFDLPYHWQWHPWGWDWKDIPNMEEVEKDFCNPDYDSHIGEECKVDFLNMKLGGHLVRRFSTASSISKPGHFILTTKWCWYWKVQDGCWREYVLEKDSKAPVTSEILEKSYQENNHGVVKFEAGPWKYTLSFAEMTQQNETTKTKRDVRRRPQFVSAQKKNELLKRTKEKKENGMSPGVSIPSHWVQTSESDTLVPVAESSEEFKKVTSLFHRTLPNNKIHKVMRNQNIELWEVYRSKRERMMRRNGGKEVMELQLFHGTNPELVPAICQQNFDWRICGSNGTLYGRGSYFARNSDYSNKYSGLDPQRKSRIMFVARVLAGTFVRGQSSYLRPPAKPPSSIELHDSCVDNELNPTIFVVFEKDQVYPEYVIEYTST